MMNDDEPWSDEPGPAVCVLEQLGPASSPPDHEGETNILLVSPGWRAVHTFSRRAGRVPSC